VVLLERAAAAEEADSEADDADGDDEDGRAVHVSAEERQVVAERRLQHGAADYEHQTDDLRVRTSPIVVVTTASALVSEDEDTGNSNPKNGRHW